jgi:hypothetical protein
MKRMIHRNVYFACIAMTILLVVTMASSLVAVTNAVGTYGYKQGDTYSFTMTTSSSSNTEEGTATSSQSVVMTYKIKNIDTDIGSYRIKVDYLLVMPTMGSGSMIQEGTMEGDPEPFISFSSYGSTPRVFVTADWNTRGDEWNNYVNAAKAVSGWMIKDYTGTHGDTNGAFTLDVQYDVSDSNSHIDFNDDGSNDGYTGTMSTSVQYDANGVLSSYSWQSKMQFNQRNSATISTSITRGGVSILPGDTVMMIVIGIVAFIIALALGFFIGRMRRPMSMMNPRSSNMQSAPPP